MIAFFSVHCSKKKGGGLGLGALALAGGGGSSSSSSSNATETVTPGGGGNGGDSTVTECKIKGDNPTYLKKYYTLSYSCQLNTKDYGKTLSFEYENSVVEIYDDSFKSIDSFKLPEQKQVNGSFQVKTLQKEAFSLKPKIDSQSFTVRNFSQTKDVPIPQGDQLKIEKVAEAGTVPDEDAGSYRLVVYKDKLYYFATNYYVTSNGKDWTKTTTDGTNQPNITNDAIVVFQDKIWSLGNLSWNWSAVEKNDGSLQWIKNQNMSFDSRQTQAIVYQNKIYLNCIPDLSKTICTSSDGLKWDKIYEYTDDDRSFNKTDPVIMDGLLWLIGGDDRINTPKKSFDTVSSFDGTNFVKDAGKLLEPNGLYGAASFRNGILIVGGFNRTTRTQYDKIWFSPYGKNWHEVKTGTEFSGAVMSLVQWKNALWLVESGKVYKITYQ